MLCNRNLNLIVDAISLRSTSALRNGLFLKHGGMRQLPHSRQKVHFVECFRQKDQRGHPPRRAMVVLVALV
jgi:hypothetical protein